MDMKRILSLVSLLLLTFTAFAQTPEEIIARMEEEMDKHEKEGMIMTMDIKIPILGTLSTKTYFLGERMRMEANTKGHLIVTWMDETTSWEYNTKDNEVIIETLKSSGEKDKSDAEMFDGITEGYDVTLKSETAGEWHLRCRRSKTNKDKDSPKNMDLVVSKSTYCPVSLKTSMRGVSMTIRDIAFGVTEKQVTFNPADYPTAKITDKRNEE